MRMCDLRVQSQVHCTLSLAYAYKVEYTLAFTGHIYYTYVFWLLCRFPCWIILVSVVTDITAIVRIKKGLWLLVYTNSVNKNLSK